jgi:hypothetical protein
VQSLSRLDMRHHSHPAPINQIPLGLDSPVNPATESALRTTFKRLRLSPRLTFEQAMSDTAYAICIRNLSEAIARRLIQPMPH